MLYTCHHAYFQSNIDSGTETVPAYKVVERVGFEPTYDTENESAELPNTLSRKRREQDLNLRYINLICTSD